MSLLANPVESPATITADYPAPDRSDVEPASVGIPTGPYPAPGSQIIRSSIISPHAPRIDFRQLEERAVPLKDDPDLLPAPVIHGQEVAQGITPLMAIQHARGALSHDMYRYIDDADPKAEEKQAVADRAAQVDEKLAMIAEDETDKQWGSTYTGFEARDLAEPLTASEFQVAFSALHKAMMARDPTKTAGFPARHDVAATLTLAQHTVPER